MKLDWQRIVMNLNKAGLSYQKISQKANVDARRIAHLARGDQFEPKFSCGLALLDLHEKFCRELHTLSELKF